MPRPGLLEVILEDVVFRILEVLEKFFHYGVDLAAELLEFFLQQILVLTIR